MSQGKSIPMASMPTSGGSSNSYAYPQPAPPSNAQAANTEQPWWAESDYIPESVQQFVEANAGLSLVCAAQVFFALMNITVKYFISSTDISIPSLIFVRQAITVIGCVITLRYIDEPYPFLGPPDTRRLLLARGTVGFAALIATYESFQGLSVSDTTAIQFLSPTVLTLLGFLFLRERPTGREVVAGVLCLFGVLLVSRPPFIFGDIEQEVDVPPGRVNLPPGQDQEDDGLTISRAAGVAWAFASVLGSSFAYLSIRAIGKRAHALHSMLYFSFICCVGTLPVILFVPGQGHLPDSFKGFFFIILIGIFGFIAQTLLTLGLQREKAGRAGLAIYTSVFFAITFELVIFHTFPSFLSLVGVSIILTSALWVAVQGAKVIEKARSGDEESAPISRSPSPLPSPELTRRGDHYSYTTVPISDEPDAYTPGNQSLGTDSTNKIGQGLQVPPNQNGGPTLGRRRSSGNSETAPKN